MCMCVFVGGVGWEAGRLRDVPSAPQSNVPLTADGCGKE